LTPKICGSSPELTLKICDSFFHQSKNPPEKEERESAPASPTPSPQAAPLSPSPPSPVVLPGLEGKEARRQEQGGRDRPEPPTARRIARRTPVPENWAPSPDDRAYARDLGLDPDVTWRPFVQHYLARQNIQLTDWSAQFRKWCHDEATKYRRRGGGQATSQNNRNAGALLASIHASAAAAMEGRR
jgi:hypothetical protein